METAILILLIGTLNIVCFFIGAKVGQKAAKGEPIETPSFHPVRAYREEQSKKEAEREQSKFNLIMENIDIYDGTGAGQKDVN